MGMMPGLFTKPFQSCSQVNPHLDSIHSLSQGASSIVSILLAGKSSFRREELLWSAKNTFRFQSCSQVNPHLDSKRYSHSLFETSVSILLAGKSSFRLGAPIPVTKNNDEFQSCSRGWALTQNWKVTRSKIKRISLFVESKSFSPTHL